jgi:Flp pilus assembly protein TadG
MRTIGNDRGAARLATMAWVFVVLAIVGVCAFDAVSIMSSRVSVENDAQTAAYAASDNWHTSHNIDDAYQAAVTSIAGKGETVLTKHFTIDSDGTVHLMLRAHAKSVLLDRIGSLRHLTVTVEHGDANSLN